MLKNVISLNVYFFSLCMDRLYKPNRYGCRDGPHLSRQQSANHADGISSIFYLERNVSEKTFMHLTESFLISCGRGECREWKYPPRFKLLHMSWIVIVTLSDNGQIILSLSIDVLHYLTMTCSSVPSHGVVTILLLPSCSNLLKLFNYNVLLYDYLTLFLTVHLFLFKLQTSWLVRKIVIVLTKALSTAKTNLLGSCYDDELRFDKTSEK